jgi:hypothetical protein
MPTTLSPMMTRGAMEAEVSGALRGLIENLHSEADALEYSHSREADAASLKLQRAAYVLERARRDAIAVLDA